jgi:hypothetical protein
MAQRPRPKSLSWAWRADTVAGLALKPQEQACPGSIKFVPLPPGARPSGKACFDLVLIEVDADAFGERLRWERSRNDELFPHLYGELDLGAVRAVLNLHARADGTHDIPELKP